MISEQRKQYFKNRYKTDPIYRAKQLARGKQYQQETRNDPAAYARRLERQREIYAIKVKELKQIKICLTCKEKFKTKYATKLTCSKECSKKRSIYVRAIYYQKHKEKIKKRVREYTRLYGHS